MNRVAYDDDSPFIQHGDTTADGHGAIAWLVGLLLGAAIASIVLWVLA